MRYQHGVTLMVPYIHLNEDQTTDRMYAKLTFKGDVDRRRVKRELGKWGKRTLQRRIHPIEQHLVIKKAFTHPCPPS